MAWVAHGVHPINLQKEFLQPAPKKKRRRNSRYSVSLGHFFEGGAEDECPLPCGLLITACGMGLLPNLPKTALNLPQKWALDNSCQKMPPMDLTCPVADATKPDFPFFQPIVCRQDAAWGNREALITWNLGPTHIALPHEYITGTPSTHAGHSTAQAPLAQRLLLVSRHGNSRRRIDWAVSLHKRLMAHSKLCIILSRYQIWLEPSFDIAPFTYSLQLKHIDWTGLTDLYKKDTTM